MTIFLFSLQHLVEPFFSDSRYRKRL